MAANLGVEYAAIYIGGILSNFSIGINQLEQMVGLIEKGNFHTKIIGAGVETEAQVLECSQIGISDIAISQKIFEKLLKPHIYTDLWTKKMNETWVKAGFEHDPLFQV